MLTTSPYMADKCTPTKHSFHQQQQSQFESLFLFIFVSQVQPQKNFFSIALEVWKLISHVNFFLLILFLAFLVIAYKLNLPLFLFLKLSLMKIYENSRFFFLAILFSLVTDNFHFRWHFFWMLSVCAVHEHAEAIDFCKSSFTSKLIRNFYQNGLILLINFYQPSTVTANKFFLSLPFLLLCVFSKPHKNLNTINMHKQKPTHKFRLNSWFFFNYTLHRPN